VEEADRQGNAVNKLWVLIPFLTVSCSRSSATSATSDAGNSIDAPTTASVAPAAAASVEEECSAATCQVISTVHGLSGPVTVFERKAAGAEAACQDEEVRQGALLLVRGCIKHEHPLTVERKGDAITVVHDGQHVPSNWVGIERATFDTKREPALTALSTSYWNRADACTHEDASWSFATMTGDVEWSASCSNREPCTKRRYVAIPRLPAAADLTRWTASALGTCATRVGHGRGTTSGKPSASFDAVLVGDVLFVQVSDDKVVTRGAVVDHVDVWTATDADGYMAHCAGTPSLPIKTTISLERLSAANTLRVDLPAGTNAIAVTYVDTDDGTHVAGSLSTSEIKASEALLGRPFDLKGYGACALSEHGAASWEPRSAPLSGEALWSP
jgi:hypothetical protein